MPFRPPSAAHPGAQSCTHLQIARTKPGQASPCWCRDATSKTRWICMGLFDGWWICKGNPSQQSGRERRAPLVWLADFLINTNSKQVANRKWETQRADPAGCNWATGAPCPASGVRAPPLPPPPRFSQSGCHAWPTPPVRLR